MGELTLSYGIEVPLEISIGSWEKVHANCVWFFIVFWWQKKSSL